MSVLGPLRQGNNVTILYTVLAGTGVVQDITGWSLLFRVKQSGQTGFVFTVAGTITAPTAGQVEVLITPTLTNPPFDAAQKYLYDFQGTDPGGAIYTLDSGTLTFTPILF